MNVRAVARGALVGILCVVLAVGLGFLIAFVLVAASASPGPMSSCSARGSPASGCSADGARR